MVSLLFGLLALMLIGLGLPLARRRVAPNLWYGFRVKATLEDEHVWYEVNEVAGRDLIATGALLLVLVLVVPAVAAIGPDATVLIYSVALITGAMGGTVRGWRLANRLRRVPPRSA